MIAVDFRNANWQALRESLQGSMSDALEAWTLHGPGTTRQISDRYGMSILTLRPRTTDLLHAGLLVLSPEQPYPREGCYQVATKEQFNAHCAKCAEEQLQLI